MSLIKRLAANLPEHQRQNLKRSMYARQIRSDEFHSEEPEWRWVGEILQEGDWVLDIGANVGHYTFRFSGLVGRTGRVVAFEPIAETFEMLAANAALFPHHNVTLINAAASETCQVATMTIPHWHEGGRNYYEAHIETVNGGSILAHGPDTFQVLCCAPDVFDLPHRIRLAKVDAEGHEPSVLKGMRRLMERDRPVLILESPDDDHPRARQPEYLAMREWLSSLGYTNRRLPDSPNRIYTAD